MNEPSVAGPFIVGRDLGRAGRLVRVLAAVVNLAAAGTVAHLMGGLTPGRAAGVVLTFMVLAIAYAALVAAIGQTVLSRIDPWLGALLVVLPLAVLFALPFVPDPVTVGAFLYVGVSQLAQAAIGYGGCEIVGIPTLVLRRRYTVYCALNGADTVEMWLQGRARWMKWAFVLAAFMITMMLGGIAEVVGSAVGFFVAYVLFLVIGFAASRVLSFRRREADRGQRRAHRYPAPEAGKTSGEVPIVGSVRTSPIRRRR